MKVAYYPQQLTTKKTTLILGSFAFFHNGHKKLVKTAKKFNSPLSLMLIADPRTLPKNSVGYIQSLNSRLNVAAKLGFDFVSVVEFDNNIQNTAGDDFIKKIVQAVNASHIVVGKDFKAGFGGKYTALTMQKDFPTTIVDFEKINQMKISTRIIKEAILAGDFQLVDSLSPFVYEDELDFDNNLEIKKLLVDIHPGVYAASLVLNDVRYWATLYVNQDKQGQIFVEDLQIKNRSFTGILEIYSQIRVIVSSKHDQILESDKDLVATFLKNRFSS